MSRINAKLQLWHPHAHVGVVRLARERVAQLLADALRLVRAQPVAVLLEHRQQPLRVAARGCLRHANLSYPAARAAAACSSKSRCRSSAAAPSCPRRTACRVTRVRRCSTSSAPPFPHSAKAACRHLRRRRWRAPAREGGSVRGVGAKVQGSRGAGGGASRLLTRRSGMSYVMGDRPSRAAAVVAGLVLEGTRKLSSLLYRILQLYLQGSAVIVTGCRRPRPTLHTFSIFF